MVKKQFFESSNISDDIKLFNEKLFKDEMVGTGMTDYITIGKYKAHRTKLMGGKLQMRSNNNNQIHNLSVIFYLNSIKMKSYILVM